MYIHFKQCYAVWGCIYTFFVPHATWVASYFWCVYISAVHPNTANTPCVRPVFISIYTKGGSLFGAFRSNTVCVEPEFWMCIYIILDLSPDFFHYFDYQFLRAVVVLVPHCPIGFFGENVCYLIRAGSPIRFCYCGIRYPLDGITPYLFMINLDTNYHCHIRSLLIPGSAISAHFNVFKCVLSRRGSSYYDYPESGTFLA